MELEALSQIIWLEYLIIFFCFGMLAGLVAAAKQRSICGWFLLGLIIGPFALVVLLLPRLGPELPLSDPARRCPECAELIQPQARKCRWCGSSLAPLNAPGPGRETQPCFACGHPNRLDAVNCERCGATW
jgi:hypothetical protein